MSISGQGVSQKKKPGKKYGNSKRHAKTERNLGAPNPCMVKRQNVLYKLCLKILNATHLMFIKNVLSKDR